MRRQITESPSQQFFAHSNLGAGVKSLFEGQSFNSMSTDVLNANSILGPAINNNDTNNTIHGALPCAQCFLYSTFHSPTRVCIHYPNFTQKDAAA